MQKQLAIEAIDTNSKKHFINAKRHTEIYLLHFIHSCGFKCLKSLALAAVQQLVSPACKSELHRRGLWSAASEKWNWNSFHLFQAVQSEIEVAVILVSIFFYLIIKTFENSSLQVWTAQTQLRPLIVKLDKWISLSFLHFNLLWNRSSLQVWTTHKQPCPFKSISYLFNYPFFQTFRFWELCLNPACMK